ncbi:hypothetical protein EIN_053480 [Entamoeba invadens IP1]|uniref:hypothetical protein n=1 Tax=Entamoeba invadens IP1 TaxID=370355 RepID=UPI0002C3DA20|nr:hypothetical protein EIN_053480 [Entamoeba invadens IP1]ELP93103.1 hypothetical protein EIN_053480 [Entamoeba invadens IP1]|eukprot:XP_004259874.1 hypothetical protein EIN_053480 [Entamoeba invadens IP1]
MEEIQEALKSIKQIKNSLTEDTVIFNLTKSIYTVLDKIVTRVFQEHFPSLPTAQSLQECKEHKHILNIENVYEQKDKEIMSELFYLEEWTGQHEFRIMYDTDIHPYTKNTLIETLNGKRNLTLLFQTKNSDLFGCYLEAPVNINEYGYSEDFDIFIFSLKSPYLLKPTKYTKLRSFADLCHFSLYFSDNEEDVLEVDGAFTLRFPLLDEVCEISTEISLSFKNASVKDFIGGYNTFALKRLLVLESY